MINPLFKYSCDNVYEPTYDVIYDWEVIEELLEDDDFYEEELEEEEEEELETELWLPGHDEVGEA